MLTSWNRGEEYTAMAESCEFGLKPSAASRVRMVGRTSA